MASLRHIVTQIRHVEQQNSAHLSSGREEDVTELETMLCSRGTEGIIKQADVETVLSSIESLDTRSHQVGILHILGALSKSLVCSGGEDILEQYCRLTFGFLLSCSPDDYIGYSNLSKKKLCRVCCTVGQVAMESGRAKQAIVPEPTGLHCLEQGRLEILTPVHAELLKLCLVSKMYSKAVSFLKSHAILSAPECYKTRSTHVLLYFYYGGMVYTGLKKYKEAMFMYLGAMTMPAFQVSEIALEAAKKYILVSLILYGDIKPIPSYASTLLTKDVKIVCENYYSLGSIVASGKDVQVFVAEREDVWRRDGNFGLVQILVGEECQRKQRIGNLGKIYSSIPRDRLVSELGLGQWEEMMRVIFSMEASERTRVKLDEKDNVLHLSEADGTDISMKDMMQLIQECQNMKDVIDEESHHIECLPECIVSQEPKGSARSREIAVEDPSA
jgi:COP9 signalosome complex subunit 3